MVTHTFTKFMAKIYWEGKDYWESIWHYRTLVNRIRIAFVPCRDYMQRAYLLLEQCCKPRFFHFSLLISTNLELVRIGVLGKNLVLFLARSFNHFMHSFELNPESPFVERNIEDPMLEGTYELSHRAIMWSTRRDLNDWPCFNPLL